MKIRLGELRKIIKEELETVEEKYMGFKKLKGKLAHQKGVHNPGALAASIGRKKYGKEAFQKAASKGKKMRETDANPWAVCTSSTGQKTGKKRERCIQKVKKQQG